MIERRADIAACAGNAGNGMTRSAATGDDEIGAPPLRVRALAGPEGVTAGYAEPKGQDQARSCKLSYFPHIGTNRIETVSQKITSAKTSPVNKPAKAKKRVRPSPTSIRS
jgi:hypothetical protein